MLDLLRPYLCSRVLPAILHLLLGSSLAAAAEPEKNVLHIRLPDLGNQSLFGPPILFSKDGRWLSVAGNLIDLKTPRYVGRLGICAFSADSKSAITGGVRPKLWAMPDGILSKGVAWNQYDEKAMETVLGAKPIADHKFKLDEYINACAFNPDGKRIAIASGDGKLRLFDIASGTQKGVALIGNNTMGIAFLAGGDSIATWSQHARGGFQIWNGESATPTALKDSTVMKNRSNDKRNCMGVSPDGRWLAEATGPPDGIANHIVFYNVEAGTRKEIAHPEASEVIFHPDGKGLFIGYENSSIIYYAKGAQGLLAGMGIGEGRKILSCIPSNNDPRDREIRAIGVSADGLTIAAVDKGGSVAVAKLGDWDIPAKYSSDLFPTTLGATWIYNVVSGTAAQDARIEIRLAGIEMFGDRMCAALEIGQNQEYSTSGAFTGRSVTMLRQTTEHWSIGEEGLSLVAQEGKPILPAGVLCHIGLKKGETQGSGKPGQGPQIKGLGVEEIKTPAGKFQAIKTRVTRFSENGDPVSEQTVWYAKGIGPVKQIMAGANGATTLELENFSSEGARIAETKAPAHRR